MLSATFSCVSNVASFAPQIARHAAIQNDVAQSQTALSMAGFGGAGAASKKKKKSGGGPKLPKLKAKSQWDRYKDLKKYKPVTVGVRIQGEEEWMEVGRVRSANDEYTEVAVARQRALIAEHSKRLFLVQIPANAVLDWGYQIDDDGEDEESSSTTWAVMDKAKGDDAPSGIEKKIGFEGVSDKASGFYCYYHEGRIIEKEEDGMGNRGSGFKAIKGK